MIPHRYRTAPVTLLLIGTAACLGDHSGPRNAVPFLTVSAGREHACAVTESGIAYCWGANDHGQLGDGTTHARAVPTRVETSVQFQSISAGFLHTCALSVGGYPYCWGANVNGEVGDGTAEQRTTPVRVSGSERYRSITTGESHSCAISTGDRGYCWGAPLGPVPPDPSRPPNELRPVPLPLGRLTDLEVGYEIAAAVEVDGTGWWWGQLPPPSPTEGGINIGVPLAVSEAPRFRAISAGNKHACAIDLDGVTRCWGRNDFGQLGDGTQTWWVEPVAVAGGVSFTAVSAHAPSHSCALTADGVAYCWGLNDHGQLGTGDATMSRVPVPVAGTFRFRGISVGFAFTCAVTTDDEVYCWGAGGVGELGDGERQDHSSPVAIAAPE